MRDPDGLTLRQRVFIKALSDPESPTFLRPSASYRVANPHCALSTSWIASHRTLRLSKVQDAMAKHWTVEQMGNRLKRYTTKLEKVGDIPQARQTVMDYAELTGQLIRKAEIRQITDEDRMLLSSMIRETLTHQSDPPHPLPVVVEPQQNDPPSVPDAATPHPS